MAIVWIILVELLCVQLVSGTCQQLGKSGPECVYDCHCNNPTNCDESSDCQGQCTSGWRGRTCQQGNVALRQTTSSSPPLTTNMISGKAVDGDLGYRSYDQFHTDGSSPAWWSVDLGDVIYVQEVVIYFRTDYKFRRNGIQLYRSTSMPNIQFPNSWGTACYTVSGLPNGTDIPDNLTITQCSGQWRYLFIYTTTVNDPSGPVLDFAEVAVYGCSKGTYGDDCSMFCYGCDSYMCNSIGQCISGCRPGWIPHPLCNQNCTVGYYGTNCTARCNQRGCNQLPAQCDSVSGYCPGGCKSNFINGDCSVCAVGWYGNNCDKQCALRQCASSTVTSSCDRYTGDCPDGGCLVGYQDSDCYRTCTAGNYGLNCLKLCSSRKCRLSQAPCDSGYGSCNDNCLTGYGGIDCSECSGTNYGENCDKSCSSRHCLIPATTCLTGDCPRGCRDGWTGSDCITECPVGSYGSGCTGSCSSRHCFVPSDSCHHVTGNCTSGCKPGKRGIDCTQNCPSGSYEVNCMKMCSSRKCEIVSPTCDSVTGKCPGRCQIGFSGGDCSTTCPAGTYGSECLNCSSRHCSGDQTCHPDGSCSQGCQSGWIGPACTQACPSGLYGLACNISCGKCINQEVCDHVTGSCPNGCEAGLTPGTCQSPCDRERYGPDCARTCADRHCTTASSCSPTSGKCDEGCQPGWTGTDCMETSSLESPSTVDQTPVVAGAVAAVVVIVLIVVFGVIIWRRRKKRSKMEAKPDHVYYNTAQPDVKVKESGPEIRQSLPFENYDSIDALSREDGGTYTTIDPVDLVEAVGVSEHMSDDTTREYEPVSGGTYEKLTSTSRDHDGDYTGLQRRNSYVNVR